MDILQPPGWAKPRGYSNGIAAEGTSIFVAGQIGWNAECQLVGDGLCDQIRQALENIVAVLKEADAGPENIVRMTWYVVDFEDYRAAEKTIGKIYREVIGRHYPAMSLLRVAELYEPGAKVEIEVTAVKANRNEP